MIKEVKNDISIYTRIRADRGSSYMVHNSATSTIPNVMAATCLAAWDILRSALLTGSSHSHEKHKDTNINGTIASARTAMARSSRDRSGIA
jgi:hypothetical protein